MSEISSNYVLPGAVICPDIEQNTVPRNCCPAVMLVPMLPTGTAEEYTVNSIPNVGTAEELFGEGSIASLMANAYLKNNPFGELEMIPFISTGAQATATIEIAGTVTDAGTISILIGTQVVNVDLITGDIDTDVADLIGAAMNAATGVPVTASAAGGLVTITAESPGLIGNQIQILIQNSSEGLVLDTTEMSGGSGSADYSLALEAIGECCCYDFFGMPDCEDVYMDQVQAAFAQRWGCECFTGGRYYNTKRGNFSDLSAYLDGRDDSFGSTVLICENEAGSDYEKLAAFIGRTHLIRCDNPATSWYKGDLLCVPNSDIGGCEDSCFTKSERNILANLGGTTTINGQNGTQIIEFDGGLGGLDSDGNVNLYLRYPQAAYQTMDLAREFSVFADRNYVNAILVDESVNTARANGKNWVTPNMIESDIKAFMASLEGDFVEGLDDLDDLITVQVNSSNPSRVDACVFFDLTSALRTMTFKIAPRVTLGGI